jgi:hypothetical protein
MATVTASYNWVSGETVTPTKLNSTAAPTVVVADNEVTTAKILDANVTTAKILDANVTTAKIADAAVTQAKLASNVATTGPAFRAYATGTTTITNNTPARVTLAAEDFDTSNCFASSRFTPNVAGYYHFNFAIRMENALAGNAILTKNGAGVTAGSHGQSGTYQSNGSDLIYLNGTTDYVELWAVHYQGTANVTTMTVTASAGGTFLSGSLARAA